MQATIHHKGETEDRFNEREVAGTLIEGIVFKKLQGHYFVYTGTDTITCSLSNRLRKYFQYPTSDPASGTLRRVQKVHDIRMVDPVAVGDVVRFIPMDDGTGHIKDIAPRRNKLMRQAAGEKALEQIIAANVDQIIPIISAANPKPKWQMLDRSLAMIESSNIPGLICLTKTDLDKRGKAIETSQIYEDIGYPVIRSSTVTGQGIDEFRRAVQGKTSVLIGMSGVGKTTLLNEVQPGLGLKVNEVSQATDKGKHTTTHLEMFPLDSGGGVVDTPGMKIFGLWDTDPSELAQLFVEMQPYVSQCHFGLSCTHTHEPNCSVKDAVEEGEISELRYKNYQKIFQYIRANGK
ncbi:MAG: ribosome small subunit-dependent GTPase A [Chloroflexota bacterium]